MSEQQEHYRNQLNTIAARSRRTNRYETGQSGPLNNPTWTATVFLNDIQYGTGTGGTKGAAKEAAARDAIDSILANGL